MSPESIISSWILNHKGLIVYSNTKETKIPITAMSEGTTYEWEDLILDSFVKITDTENLSKNIENLTKFEFDINFQFSPSAVMYYYYSKGDSYFFLTPAATNISLIKDELTNCLKLRNAMKDRFNGIIFCDFKDAEGPVPVYNNSSLNEDTATYLAVQGMALAAMGATDINDSVVAIPVPGSSTNQALVFNFKRMVTDSEDPRIQLGGRPGTIYLIFDTEKIEKQVQEFVEIYLSQWKLAPDLTSEGLEQLAENLRLIVTFAWDLIRVKAKQDEYLRELITRLNELVSRLNYEITLLHEENNRLKAESIKKMGSSNLSAEEKAPIRVKKAAARKTSTQKSKSTQKQ